MYVCCNNKKMKICFKNISLLSLRHFLFAFNFNYGFVYLKNFKLNGDIVYYYFKYYFKNGNYLTCKWEVVKIGIFLIKKEQNSVKL